MVKETASSRNSAPGSKSKTSNYRSHSKTPNFSEVSCKSSPMKKLRNGKYVANTYEEDLQK